MTAPLPEEIAALLAPVPETDGAPGGAGVSLRYDPATVAINGGTEAAAESAIGANVTTVCRCVTATAWICTDYSTAGVVTATEVAAA